jgi:hypothetical protein
MLWESQTHTGDTKSFQEALLIIVLATVQWIKIQRLDPESKGVLPCIPLQAGYRSKKPCFTQIWLHVSLLTTPSAS